MTIGSRVLIVTALAALLFGCGDSAPPAATTPQAPPVTLDEAIETGMRSLLRSTADAAAAAAPSLVLRDDTPRLEGPPPRPEDARYVLLPGASCHVPLQGLATVRVGVDDRGFNLTLDYSQVQVTVVDATGAPNTARELVRLRGMAADFWEDTWPDLVAQVQGTGAVLGEAKEDVAARLEQAKRRFDLWDARFQRHARSMRDLRRAALSAEAAREEASLESLYATARWLRLKAALVREAPGAKDLEASAIAAGPAVGFQKGVPGRDKERVLRLDGVRDLAIVLHARAEDAAGVAAFEDRFLALARSFRPYAGGASRKGEAASLPITVLDAVTAFHGRRDVARARDLLQTLVAADALHDTDAGPALAEYLTEVIGGGDEELAALQAAAAKAK